MDSFETNDLKSLMYFILTYMTWKSESESVLPDMIYIYDIKDVIKFIKVFGGKTVKVPTFSELSDSMIEILAAYLYHKDRCSHSYIQTLLKIDGRKYSSMKSRIEDFNTYLCNVGSAQ